MLDVLLPPLSEPAAGRQARSSRASRCGYGASASAHRWLASYAISHFSTTLSATRPPSALVTDCKGCALLRSFRFALDKCRGGPGNSAVRQSGLTRAGFEGAQPLLERPVGFAQLAHFLAQRLQLRDLLP